MFSEYPPLPPQVIEQLHHHEGFAFPPHFLPLTFTVRDYVYDDTDPQ